jgi:enamine deaminase RidA (YjgF/YER057c/UK114 family)
VSAPEILVAGWPVPKGYANARVGVGHALQIGGQIGWDANRAFVPGGLVPQFGKTLENILAIVAAAGGVATDIASMTVYVTDIEAYRAAQKELGAVWRERMGKHFPAMALVAVTALVEREAVVEIQAVAYIEPPRSVPA